MRHVVHPSGYLLNWQNVGGRGRTPPLLPDGAAEGPSEMGLSILEPAQVHHKVFAEVLADTPPHDVARVAAAASDFFLHVLATYHMAQRAYLAKGLSTIDC